MKIKTLSQLLPTRWPRWLRLLAGVVVFAAFAAVVLDNWRQLTEISWHLDAAPLVLSVCFLLMTYYFNVLGWHWIVKRLGGGCAFGDAARIWLYSNLARYLPGSVWYTAGRVVLSTEAGISPVTTSVGVVLEIAFLLISRVLVVAVTWPLWTSHVLPDIPSLRLGSVQGSLSAVLIAGALIVVHPGVLNWFFAQYQRLRSQESDTVGESGQHNETQKTVGVRLQYRDTLQILVIFVMQALLIGVAFYFLMRSVVSLPLSVMPFAVGAFALAWLIGFASIVIPSGLGVREGALIYLLSATVTEPTAIMIAVLSRAWVTAGELLCVLLVKLVESQWLQNRSEGVAKSGICSSYRAPAGHHEA